MSSDPAPGTSHFRKEDRTFGKNTYNHEDSPAIQEDLFNLDISSLNVNYETDCGDDSLNSFPLPDEITFVGKISRSITTDYTFKKSCRLRSDITTEVRCFYTSLLK